MAQVWKCIKCGYATWNPQDAGDHERKYNDGELLLFSKDENGEVTHYMDDIGE